jgi:hypothetical protein
VAGTLSGGMDLAHQKLDESVFSAYGWDSGMRVDKILANLLRMNLAHGKQ